MLCCIKDVAQTPQSKLLDTNKNKDIIVECGSSPYTEPISEAGTASTAKNEAATTTNCRFWLSIWLQICGYPSGCKSRKLYTVSQVVIITSALALAIYKMITADWYHFINQSVWVVTTYCTMYGLHRNLSQVPVHFFKTAGFGKLEFNVCCMLFAVMMVIIKTAPYYDQDVCPGSNELLDVLGTIASWIVNVVSMYTLNMVLLWFCCVQMWQYNVLEADIVRGYQDGQPLHVDKVKRRYFELRDDIKKFKNDWEWVVTLSFCYHMLYVIVSTGIWVTNTSNNVWVYCTDDQWAQLLIVITRGCARIFGLLYGILRLNHKPQTLAEMVDKYCDWDDAKQQPVIIRLVDNIRHYPEQFRVMSVNMEWVQFRGIIYSALITAAGTLLKAKLSSLQ